MITDPHKWPVTQKMFPFDDVIMHTNLEDIVSGYKRRDSVQKLRIMLVFLQLTDTLIFSPAIVHVALKLQKIVLDCIVLHHEVS